MGKKLLTIYGHGMSDDIEVIDDGYLETKGAVTLQVNDNVCGKKMRISVNLDDVIAKLALVKAECT